ncbi:MAG: exonuclease SbcCD subunit D [Candidatus Caldatribacteriota bacterium]|nr:exonuclease SbcCD subunit D [Candidatus Caldatribacteriota bacterium]
MKFLHIADIHLGMENYGRIDPSTGLHTRLQDFIKCFSFAIDVALEEKVDLVIFAGDAYKNSFPNPTHQREFARQIYRLSNARIPIVLVSGNHDNPVSFGKATSLEIFNTLNIPGVKVVTDPELFNIETKSGAVQIFALPWPTKSQYLAKEEYKNFTDKEITGEIQERVSEKIIKYAKMMKPNIPSIFTAHLAAKDAVYSGSERSAIIGRDPVFSTEILAREEFDYVALGHIHRFQDLNPQNHPPVIYPGSIERINFGEEKEDKGFCMATIEKSKTNYEFIPVPAKRFITIDIIIEEEHNPTKTILKEIEKYDLSGAIVRVFYTILAEREELIDFKKINNALDDAFLVAAISRKTKKIEKSQRAEISEDLGMLDAMDKYIQNKRDLIPIADKLRTYAQNLEQELEDKKYT